MGTRSGRKMIVWILLGVLCGWSLMCDAACSNKEFAQFECSSDGKCIDQEQTCNSIKDCADGSDEALNNCTNGCLFNTTVIKPGETGQDLEWWYTCTRSRWLVSGCVVNGQRFRQGDTFQLLTRQGIFWGKCEKIDQYHYMRQPYGCVDASGRNVDNGQIFQMNQLFWGVCSVNRTTTSAPGLGNVPVNDVKWRIAGCNDGSQKVVKDGAEFSWIIDPFRLLGVQIKCRVPKKDNEWPDIKPTACLVNVPPNTTTANAAPNFKILRHKCYAPIDKLIYYCTISPKATTVPPQVVGKISTWEDDWLLNITDNNADELNILKAKGFSACSETPQTQPVVPKIPLPPPLPPPLTDAKGAPRQAPPRLPAGGQTQNQSPVQNAPGGGTPQRHPTKRDTVEWWRRVNVRGSRSVRSLFSGRVSSQGMAKSIFV